MGMDGQHHAPRRFTPGKRLVSHCTGDWMGSGTGLDRCEKISPLPEMNPRTVQPVAIFYTGWATPANSPWLQLLYVLCLSVSLLSS
jgi:hypothetical protein